MFAVFTKPYGMSTVDAKEAAADRRLRSRLSPRAAEASRVLMRATAAVEERGSSGEVGLADLQREITTRG